MLDVTQTRVVLACCVLTSALIALSCDDEARPAASNDGGIPIPADGDPDGNVPVSTEGGSDGGSPAFTDSSSDGGVPAPSDGSTDARIIIASGQESPTGIAVDEATVYFASRGAGTIAKCPRVGCGSAEPVVLASEQDNPIAVAVDTTHLYWVTGWQEGDRGAPASRPVFRCPLPGCDAASIEAFDTGTYQPYGIRVASARVYLAAWPSIVSCPLTGCSSGVTEFGSGPAVSVDVHESSVYVALAARGEVQRCSSMGCSMPSLISGISPVSIAVDETSLYVADYAIFGAPSAADAGREKGRVLRCAREGCDPAGPDTLESGDISPYALALYADRLYYTSIEDGLVVSIPK